MQTIREKNTFCTHFSVIPLCQRSIIQCFKCQDRTLHFHCILYYIFIPYLYAYIRVYIYLFMSRWRFTACYPFFVYSVLWGFCLYIFCLACINFVCLFLLSCLSFLYKFVSFIYRVPFFDF